MVRNKTMSTTLKSNDGYPEDDQLPTYIREDVLDRDNHRCRLCGNRGPGAGGIFELECHHISYDPEIGEIHDSSNLLTLCRRCHNYHHNRPTEEGIPAKISDEAQSKLLEIDIEIIRILADGGPLSTDEIHRQLSDNRSRGSVKERLYRVMGLDNETDSQEIQLIDQDKNSKKWGLPHQIEDSERRNPTERQQIVRRTIDKIVLRNINQGVDREIISNIVGIDYRTSYIYQYRANAYDFPVDRYLGQGRPRMD